MNRHCALLLITALLTACMPIQAWATSPGPIAVIISAKGDHHSIGLEDLTLIYQRKKLFWDNGKKIHPVNLTAAHPIRQAFSQRVLGQPPEAMQGYWNDMYFHGILPPYVLSSEMAVKQFVINTPGAIGYVAYCDLTADKNIAVALVIPSSGPINATQSDLGCPP